MNRSSAAAGPPGVEAWTRPAQTDGTRQTDLFDYDAELRLHNDLFRAAARVGSRDRVLDIGCGTGQSTREAARTAVTGSVVAATAFDNVLRLREYKDLLANLDTATAEQARTRLRATLAAHNTDSGVYFDSRAWIITVRRH